MKSLIPASLSWCAVLAFALAPGCASEKPRAMAVCTALERASVAVNCEPSSERGGLVTTARERASFDLKTTAGKTGQILTFSSVGDYDTTVTAFDAAALLAGRHRYGSRNGLVFVQMNAEASQAEGDAAQKVVAGYD